MFPDKTHSPSPQDCSVRQTWPTLLSTDNNQIELLYSNVTSLPSRFWRAQPHTISSIIHIYSFIYIIHMYMLGTIIIYTSASIYIYKYTHSKWKRKKIFHSNLFHDSNALSWRKSLVTTSVCFPIYILYSRFFFRFPFSPYPPNVFFMLYFSSALFSPLLSTHSQIPSSLSI